MASNEDLETAFDAAIEQVQRAISAGLTADDGHPIADKLGQLEFRLRTERANAIERQMVDREWVQKTIRWVVDWVPESDLTILAALGRIARLTSSGVS
jgi:hypothetical protein